MSNNPLQKSGFIRFSDIMKEKEWLGSEGKTMTALVEQNDRLSPNLVLNLYNPTVMTSRISTKPYSISSWFGYNHALGENMTILDGTITGGNMKSMVKTRYITGSGGFYSQHYSNISGLFTACTSTDADSISQGNTALSAYNTYEVTERSTGQAGNYMVSIQRPYLEIDLTGINPNRRIANAELTLTGLTNTYSACRMILVNYEETTWSTGGFYWRHVISDPVMFTMGDQTFTLNAYGVALINAAIASADKNLRLGLITYDWDYTWEPYIGQNLISGDNQTFNTIGNWQGEYNVTLEVVTTNINRSLEGRKALHVNKASVSELLRFSLNSSYFSFTPSNGVDYYTHCCYRFDNFSSPFYTFTSETSLMGSILGNTSAPVNPYLIKPQDPSLTSTNWFRAGWNNRIDNKAYPGQNTLGFKIGSLDNNSISDFYLIDLRIVPILFSKTWGAKYNNPRLKYYYAGLPGSVSTGLVSNISASGATVAVTINTDGYTNILASGICWNTTGSPTIANSKTTDGNTSVSSFNASMSGLSLGTTYYIRSYVTTEVGTTYGAQTSVTTLGLPTVTTQAATGVSYTTATFNGTASVDGGQGITDRGFVYKAGGEPAISDNKTSASSPTGTGSFTLAKTGLSSGVTYYVRSYATNASGTQLSSASVSFTTLLNLPTVTFSTPTTYEPQATYVTLNGEATQDGGSTITDRGFVYKAGSNPTASDNKTSATTPTGTGSFSKTISGLTPNTTYYFASYATNANGTSLSGTFGSFTTAIGVPVVNSTTTATNIGQNSATSGGYISTDNSFPITERGICWNTTGNPTISGSKATSGTGTGTFSVSMTGLTLGTTYYVRCYGINSAGVGYAGQVTFTTLGATIPLVSSTTAVSNISQTAATSGGNVSSDGGSAITERGICWSNGAGPTIANSKATASGTIGTFGANLAGLSASTTYYVRAYAINALGTAYGDQVSFTTAAQLYAPTITSTTSVTNIAQTTATSGGNVSSDGGATITERGICWATSQNPTTSGAKQTASGTTGSFSANLAGLSASTTYYVRAYAINSEGTSYATQVSFSTAANISLPAVSTTTPGQVTYNSFWVGCYVSADGGATVTERGYVMNTSGSPTTGSYTHRGYNGSGTGYCDIYVSGLSPNTTYYVRGYAINSAGTAYGSQLSFTTGSAPVTPTVYTDSPATNIGPNGATVSGGVSSDGGASVTERGICYNTSGSPTTSNSVVTSGTGTGTFSVSLSGLSQSTTYYARAYAINSAGTAYGTQISFTTSGEASLPTVVTQGPDAWSSINSWPKATIIWPWCQVSSDGGATVTERGVVWGWTNNPTTSNFKATAASGGTGTYECSANVFNGETFYYRAYAINAIGTAYGNCYQITLQENFWDM